MAVWKVEKKNVFMIPFLKVVLGMLMSRLHFSEYNKEILLPVTVIFVVGFRTLDGLGKGNLPLYWHRRISGKKKCSTVL